MSVIDIGKSTVREFLEDDAMRMAAALSYYTVFSLPPILILLLLTTGLFVDPATIEAGLTGQVEGVLGEDAAAQVQTMMAQTADFDGGALAAALTILALAFGATGAFGQLQAMLNKAWGVAPDPEQGGVKVFLTKRVLSFGMVLVIAFLLLVSLVLSAILTRAGGAIADALPGALSGAMLVALDVALSLAVFTLLFAALFRILPDAAIGWRDVAVGAFATALVFLLIKYLFGYILSLADPGSAFGAAGSLAVILVWVYFSSMALFLGAEFTQVWARERGSRIRPSDGAIRVPKGRV